MGSPSREHAITPRPGAAVTLTPDKNRGVVVLAMADDTERFAAAGALTARGYTVFPAADGSAALAAYAAAGGAADLVIADLVMPGMTGRQLATAFRWAGQAVQLLLTGGYGRREVRERSAAGPGFPFLAKPWTVQTLLVLVDELVSSRRAATLDPRLAKS